MRSNHIVHHTRTSAKSIHNTADNKGDIEFLVSVLQRKGTFNGSVFEFFRVVQFMYIAVQGVVLVYKAVDEILKCAHSNESH